MKLIPCPLNGPRPALEFAYGGEVRPMPDAQHCSDAEWTAWLFDRSGVPGVKREWWFHIASGYWFIAERDTVRDEFLRCYPVSDLAAQPATIAQMAQGDAP